MTNVVLKHRGDIEDYF